MKKYGLILCVFFAHVLNAQTISTVAGNGIAGFGGNGGAATLAALDSPMGIALDRAGNLYIADTKNNCIRKVTPTGNITQYAGTGMGGYAGDGGPATAALLNHPIGLTFDAAGNLYIADQFNNVIREVNTAGNMATKAGNGTIGHSGDDSAATAASLYLPAGITEDGYGNLFIADQGNNCVRIVFSNSIIKTWAGTTTAGFSGDAGPATLAQLNAPCGVSIDLYGNLLIADTRNNRIRKVTTSSIIYTVAGNGSPIYGGDGQPATAAGLNGPTGAVMNALGSIYIADRENERVRLVTPQGVMNTDAGTGTAGFSGDGGNATGASLYNPASVTCDAAGDVYVADAGNERIRYIKCKLQNYQHISGLDSICAGDSTVFTDSLHGGIWTSFPVYIALDTNGIVHGLTSGQATIFHIIYTSCGADTDAKVVTVNSLPLSGTIAGRNKLCAGATASYVDAATGPVETWSMSSAGVASLDSNRITGLSPGTVVLSYTIGPDSNGCSNSAYYQVTVIESSLSINALVSPPLCAGSADGSIVVTGSGGIGPYIGLWQNGISSFILNNLSPGYYSMLLTDSSTLCTATDTLTVDSTLPLLVATAVQAAYCGSDLGAATLSASGGTPPYSCLWPNGDTVSFLSNLVAGNYVVAVSDYNGCSASATVIVNDSCAQVIVHNVVTPNGDGVNDYWFVEHIDRYPGSVVHVFDEGGREVYVSHNYQQDWDGHASNGTKLPDGTYYYLVEINATSGAGDSGTLKGYLLLKR